MRLRIADSNIAPEQDLPVLGGYRAQTPPSSLPAPAPAGLPRRQAVLPAVGNDILERSPWAGVSRNRLPSSIFMPRPDPAQEALSQDGGYDAGSRDRCCDSCRPTEGNFHFAPEP